MRRAPARFAAVAVLVLSAAAARSAAQDGSPPSSARLLDLPYLAQTEQLCGGAAVAMVMRYWGDQRVLPQDFAPLVDRETQGIHTSTLTSAVHDRGWQTINLTAPAEDPVAAIRDQIGRGRPVVALLEERPDVYHYVVVIGVTNTAIILHDPARAPRQVMTMSEFNRRWSAAGRWLLLILPTDNPSTRALAADAAPASRSPGTASAASPSVNTAPANPSACTNMVERGVALGRAGERDQAEEALIAATRQCPNDASAWGELAGLRFVERRYPDAGELAAHALELAPDDENARTVLAMSRYLQDDLVGALETWNGMGRPRLDVISVDGLERTNHPAVIDRLGLSPGHLLEAGAFVRAGRRLDELPIASSSSLTYRPGTNADVQVQAIVSERSVLPKGVIGWATVGLRSAFLREVEIDVAGLTPQGEVWSPAYRWSANRPQVRLEFEMPAPGGLPGLVNVETFWERQSYAPGVPGQATIREERRRSDVRFSDWATSWLRWTAGGATDHIGDRGFVSLIGQLDTRTFGDRIWVRTIAEQWAPTAGGGGFFAGQANLAWRSTTNDRAPVWSSVVGMAGASTDAPLAEWPVAGSSNSRGALVRGHTLYHNGVITSPLLGRRLVFASAEYQHPAYATSQGQVQLAGFVDAGRAWRRLDPDTANVQVDVGAGVRFSSPLAGATIRLDVGYGLRDGHAKLSAGYVMPWGR